MADTFRKVDYYNATLTDKPGEGASLLGSFKDAGVNFRAIHAFPIGGGKTQVDLIPENADAFQSAATKAGVKLSAPKAVFLLEGDDRVGATADTLSRLGKAGVNVTAVTSVVSGGRYGTLVWVKPADVAKAGATLGVK